MKGKVYVLLLMIVSFVGKSQDNHYSQFYANKIYLNPAFAGTDVCPRVILGFRDQWPGLSGEYVSYTASYDQSINGLGFGVLFNGDDAGRGVLKTNNISTIISPKVRISQYLTLSVALEAGIIQKRLDHSTLTYPSQFTQNGMIQGAPQEILEDKSRLSPDFSSGLLLYSKHVYAGYSIHHMFTPNISLLNSVEPLYRRHTGHIGVNILLPEKNPQKRRKGLGPKLSPQIIYQQQGPAYELNLGMYYSKNNFTTGLYYRNDDALVLLFGANTKKFSFGFSYDVTVSKLANNTLGAFELSTAYKFKCRQRRRNPVRIDCPSF